MNQKNMKESVGLPKDSSPHPKAEKIEKINEKWKWK